MVQKKELYIMEDTSHGLMVSKSNEFLDILHLIFKKYKWFMSNLKNMLSERCN